MVCRLEYLCSETITNKIVSGPEIALYSSAIFASKNGKRGRGLEGNLLIPIRGCLSAGGLMRWVDCESTDWQPAVGYPKYRHDARLALNDAVALN